MHCSYLGCPLYHRPSTKYHFRDVVRFSNLRGLIVVDCLFLFFLKPEILGLAKMLCCLHIKIWNLASHMKTNETKDIRLLVFSFSSINLVFLMFFALFLHEVCKISNFNNMWTAKNLAQASCTELTLYVMIFFTCLSSNFCCQTHFT